MTDQLNAGRRAGTQRRKQKVLHLIAAAAKNGTELTVSAVARQASVDRSFLYRHRDLLQQLHLAQTTPVLAATGPAVSRESLRADLANAHARSNRLQTRVQQLEKRLSDHLGEQAWRESGLGAAADIDALQRANTHLEHQIAELHATLEERDRELAAARAANRELIRSNSAAMLTRTSPPRGPGSRANPR